MRILRFCGFEIKTQFTVERFKTLTFDIPDWADDTHLRQGGKGDYGTPDGKTKICYFKGSKPFYIDLPEHKRAVKVSITPLRDYGCLEHNTNRKVVVDVFY
jgi:hypothetical protein